MARRFILRNHLYQKEHIRMVTPVKSHKSNIACATIAMLCAAMPLSAAVKEADACAAKLTAGQKLIYDAVKPEVTPATKLNPLVRSKTIALFKAGKISKAKAPGDAKIAANCLKLMQN
jgi:hypothetical protein